MSAGVDRVMKLLLSDAAVAGLFASILFDPRYRPIAVVVGTHGWVEGLHVFETREVAPELRERLEACGYTMEDVPDLKTVDRLALGAALEVRRLKGLARGRNRNGRYVVVDLQWAKTELGMPILTHEDQAPIRSAHAIVCEILQENARLYGWADYAKVAGVV